MSPRFPTATDFICGHQTTLQHFELEKVIGTATVDAVDYHLVYGTWSDQFDGQSKPTYLVVCYDDLFGWRSVLLRQPGYPDGFNYLAEQVIPPRRLGADANQPDTLFDLECYENRRVITRSVLRPYRFPFKIGTSIGNQTIVAVGRPLFFGDNYSGIVPVQFRVGHGLLFCWRKIRRRRQSSNREVAKLLAESETMPIIQNGIGANTWHVLVTEHGKEVALKLFYNGKGMRYEDEVVR